MGRCIVLLFVPALVCTVAHAQISQLSERFCLVHGQPDLMLELGTGWNRFDFSWSGIEPEKGIFDFSNLDRELERFTSQGLHVLPILDYNPAWASHKSPGDDSTRELWARYVARTVAHFKDDMVYWQVWNEPNIDFWQPTPNPRDYTELLRVSYETIKAVDPEAQVIGVNCSGIDLDFTEAVFRYGGLRYCDVVAYQPYRIAPEVGHFEEVAAVRALMKRFGGEKPLWFTELGWNTEHFPFSGASNWMGDRPMRRQAAYLVRYMVLCQAAGIEKAFWFSQAAGGHGLAHQYTGEKRSSFFAYEHLIDLLNDYTNVAAIVPPGAFGVYAYLFETPERTVVVAWSVNGPQECRVPGMSDAEEMQDMFGKKLLAPAGDVLEVNEEPLYLVFKNAPDELHDITAAQFAAGRVWVSPGETAQVAIVKDSSVPELAASFPVGLSVHELDDTEGIELVAAADAVPGQTTLTLSTESAAWNVEVNIAPRELWRYEGESEGYLEPVVWHDADGTPGILVGAHDTAELVCLNANGSQRWRYLAGAPLFDSATVVDIRGDERPEIIAAMPNQHQIFVLDADGVLQWRARILGEPPLDTPAWRWTKPEVVSDAQGAKEIVIGDQHGYVTAFSPEGETLWRTFVSSVRCDKPIGVADIHDEPGEELVVGDADGVLHCLSASGAILWKRATSSEITSAPLTANLGPDGTPAVLVANANEVLTCVNGDGEVLWETNAGGTVDLGTGPEVTNVNGDGALDIVLSTRNQEVLLLDAAGAIQWRAATGAQLRGRPVIADMNGDGAPEILVGATDHLVYCIDAKGEVVWTCNVGDRVDTSLAAADLDGDGAADVIVPVRGGTIRALAGTAK